MLEYKSQSNLKHYFRVGEIRFGLQFLMFLLRKKGGSFVFFILYCIFFPLPFSLLYPPTHSNHQPVVHAHESFCAQSPHLLISPPLQSCQPCSPSMSLSPFSLLVQFVHYIPHMNEIIQYLSFSDWFISLSIMFSRSIHTVTKGKIFFLWLSRWFLIYTIQTLDYQFQLCRPDWQIFYFLQKVCQKVFGIFDLCINLYSPDY